MTSILAHRHVAFEDLDGFVPALERHGFDITYRDALLDTHPYDPLEPELMVVLGAPCGVYEKDDYPFIAEEIDAVRQRIAADRPVLGICFGAQIIAEALGSKVFPGQPFEFGWSPIALTDAGTTSAIRHFASQGREVFHCHGDTFDLPEGATLLASTPSYRNQAFRYGPHLGVQFHAEVSERGLRRWYIGQAARARAAGGVSKLRSKTDELAPAMVGVHDEMITEWLAEIGLLSPGATPETINQRGGMNRFLTTNGRS
ncbi:glutamine amidotransferase [Nitratireductor soli]|uniref:glutamine amidotransferase n=1 Tax=Nitratireductor soli TaxID=1670619 RepID=UPI00069EBF15|nr:glutamine amidotransferase [Nitratireductor soli]